MCQMTGATNFGTTRVAPFLCNVVLEKERERILYLYTATSKQVLRRGG